MAQINTKAGDGRRGEDGGVPFSFSMPYQRMLLKPGEFSRFVHSDQPGGKNFLLQMSLTRPNT